MSDLRVMRVLDSSRVTAEDIKRAENGGDHECNPTTNQMISLPSTEDPLGNRPEIRLRIKIKIKKGER